MTCRRKRDGYEDLEMQDAGAGVDRVGEMDDGRRVRGGVLRGKRKG